MFKRIAMGLMSILLVLSLCSCSYIDKWLEEEEVVVITPATPHAAADYSGGIFYFWNDFSLVTADNRVVLRFSDLDELSGYDFSVDEWYADSSSLRLALTGVISERDLETDLTIKRYCDLNVEYRSDLKFDSISTSTYTTLWPENTTLDTLSSNDQRIMLRLDTQMVSLVRIPTGGTVLLSLQPYAFSETGDKVLYTLANNPTLDTEIRTVMNFLATKHLDWTIDPTETQQTEQIPTSLCFWTKELALQFPCTFLSSAANGTLEWLYKDAETGKTQRFTLTREPIAVGELPEGTLSSLEYYQTNLAKADQKLSEAYGATLVPHDDHYLFYDSITHQLYRLYVQ